ncbi:hypothetical protein [Solimonas marina]|uniref:Uncharacterized protein n=1 Tax=Solimonas marina TaxID=2714601 RepID=A0A969W8I4_9GAMM|nr:hypothetical protein [Solimonas marina]NKF22592.1 hypothetical protein [Solimonas marina]
MSAAPDDAQGWLTLRELDDEACLPKGSAFRVFKRLADSWHEGRDYAVLDSQHDAAAVTALRQNQRLYPHSVKAILLAPAAGAAVLQALQSR